VQGVEHLFSHNVIPETPEALATFLYNSDRLNATKLGEYIAKKYFSPCTCEVRADRAAAIFTTLFALHSCNTLTCAIYPTTLRFADS
jgi:hypothetical protein